MNIDDRIFINATVIDVPDDDDDPGDRFYTFKIEPTVSDNNAEWVSIREEDVPRVVASGFGWPAEHLPIGTVVKGTGWVAVRDEYPNYPWDRTGGYSRASDATIDLEIARGEARVLLVGDGSKPAEVEPETSQMGILAVIDADPDNPNHPSRQLTDRSTITIAGTTHPIPARANGLRFAPTRVGQAIKEAGYRPVGDYYTAISEDGRTIRVEPISE